jgi:anti-anti-sigma factor
MTSHDVNEVIVLRPQKDLCEGEECDAMQRTLEDLARQGRAVIVDLSETRMLSAHAVGVLAQAARVAAQHGGRLALCGAARLERWVLDVTRLAQVVPVFGTAEDAVAAMQTLRMAV